MRGLSTAVIGFILVMTTLVLMLGVLTLYSFYFSNESSSAFSQSYLVGLSKLVQFQISNLAFYGIPPNYSYFNVSYFIWVSSPTKIVTIVVFNETPTPPNLLSYTLPPSNVKVGLFKSQPQGYVSLQSFTINSNVYSPTGGLLGVINAKAYNVSSNTTYILSSIIKPNNIVVVWVLYNYQGKWYRLAWTYTSPANQGLGVYTLSSSGIVSSSNPSNAVVPHYVTSNKGMMFGLWFKVVNNQTNALVSNLTLTTVNNNNVSIIVFMKSGGLYLNISKNGVVYTTTTILQNLNQGAWYFLNISFGAQLNSGTSNPFMNISIYSTNQKLLRSISITQQQLSFTSLNGYLNSVKFGSSVLSTAISQAFIVSSQSSSGATSFYNVSKTVLENGYYYNDTNNLKQIMANANNQLYAIVYWYFVWPYSNPPPPSIPAIMWYYPSGSSTLATTYIYSTGQNSYFIA